MIYSTTVGEDLPSLQFLVESLWEYQAEMQKLNIPDPKEFVSRCRVLKQQRLDEMQALQSSGPVPALQSSHALSLPPQIGTQQSLAVNFETLHSPNSNSNTPTTQSTASTNSNVSALNQTSQFNLTASTSSDPNSGLRGGGVGLCRACGMRQSCVVLLPCAHLCMCEQCSRAAQRCLVCAQPIANTVRTYT